MNMTADHTIRRYEHIKSLEAKGMNIAQISRATGYSRKYVSRTLAGKPLERQNRQVWTGVLARTLGLDSLEVDRLSKRTGRFTGSSRLPDVNGFYVYFLVGDNDSLLYIGQSTNLYARLGAHMADPLKRDKVHHVEFFKCESKEHMDRVERILIEMVNPNWNIVHNSKTPDLAVSNPQEG